VYNRRDRGGRPELGLPRLRHHGALTSSPVAAGRFAPEPHGTTLRPKWQPLSVAHPVPRSLLQAYSIVWEWEGSRVGPRVFKTVARWARTLRVTVPLEDPLPPHPPLAAVSRSEDAERQKSSDFPPVREPDFVSCVGWTFFMLLRGLCTSGIEPVHDQGGGYQEPRQEQRSQIGPRSQQEEHNAAADGQPDDAEESVVAPNQPRCLARMEGSLLLEPLAGVLGARAGGWADGDSLSRPDRQALVCPNVSAPGNHGLTGKGR
jgi:hypothetical protein